MSSLTIYTYPGNYRVQKAQVAAAYNGITLNVPAFEFGKDNETPEFIAKFPLGKVPAMDTPFGPLYESGAIARYIARLRPDTHLLGKSFHEQSLVDQWIDSCANELEAPRGAWIYPILGYMTYSKEVSEVAKADVSTYLAMMNNHLLNQTFLVGEAITLADISVASALVQMYQMLFEPKFIEPFPNVNRWFNTCINQPEFASVFGEVIFCTTEAQPPTPAKDAKQDGGKKEGAKEDGAKKDGAKKDGAKKDAAKKGSKKEESGTEGGEGKQKGSKKQGGSNKKSGSKKGKQEKQPKDKKKDDLIDGIPKAEWKEIDKEGGKKGQDLQGMAAFGCALFHASIDSANGDQKKMDIVMAAMNKPVDPEAEERRGGAGEVGKIIVSSGEANLALLCHVPKEIQEEKKDVFSMRDWFLACCEKVGATVVEETEETMRANLAADPDNNIFPIKLKDEAISAGYAYLVSKQLVVDEDEDDQEDYAADAGVSWSKGASASY